MKMVMSHTYEVTMTDEQFDVFADAFVAFEKECGTADPRTNMSPEEFRRELVVWMIESSHVGDFTHYVTHTKTDILEDEA
jgi:hypothetical protein